LRRVSLGRVRFTAVFFVIAALTLPAAASGATLGRVGSELRYEAAPGEGNQIEVALTPDEKELVVRGYLAYLPSAGPGCTREPTDPPVDDEVHCPIDGVTHIALELGDSYDFAELRVPDPAPPVTIHGGDGVDTASFAPFPPPLFAVRVSLDGIANDGYGGRADDVATDVENVYGTGDSDELTGNNGPNDFFGGDGSDIFRMGGGDDVVDSIEYVDCPPHGWPCAAPVADTVRCGAGFDRVEADETDHVRADCELVAVNSRIDLTDRADRFTLYRTALSVYGHRGNDVITGFAIPEGAISQDRIDGGEGRDVLNGRNADDVLTGGSGRDRVSGGRGADTIRVRDGQRDSVACGRGRDVVLADRKDRVAKDCEKVRRRKA
jgi:hemolysin type calcium-binding protein